MFQPMNDMPQMVAFTILLLVLFIGDFVSIRTKVRIPSVFVCAVLFLLGYWTFFPKDIVARAGIAPSVVFLCMYLLITNMGTLLSLKELIRQWRTVLISLSGIFGVVIICLTVGYLFLDMNTVFVAIPPLVGGVVSTLMMSSAAKAANLPELIVLPILVFVAQGFVGYPLTSWMLKKEGRYVLERYRNNEWSESLNTSQEEVQLNDSAPENTLPKLFKWLPISYNTIYFQILRVAFVAYLAYLVADLIKPAISVSPFILCLVFGVIATSLGFLEKHPLQKANAFGFTIMALMLFIFDSLNHATPDMLKGLITPLLILMATSGVGLYLFSYIAGKILKVSTAMAYAISLTALYGFPADYIITVEVVNTLTQDEKEREVLTNHMLPSMLIGGFVSVTIVSVILAGVFVNMLTAAS